MRTLQISTQLCVNMIAAHVFLSVGYIAHKELTQRLSNKKLRTWK